MTKRKSPKVEIARLCKMAVNPIVMAVDTEFDKSHTLTVQLVHRRNKEVLEAQVYRSPGIPKPSNHESLAEVISFKSDAYGPFFERLVVRTVKPITESLSPASLIVNIAHLSHATCLSRDDAREILNSQPANLQHGEWDEERKRWAVPTITIILNAHFWPADFLRVFGSDLYSQVFQAGDRIQSPIKMRNKPTMSFVTGSGLGMPPVLEYLAIGNDFICGVRVETGDNMLPFGKGSLNGQSQTFLGFGKSEDVTADEKSAMMKTFRSKPDEAYKYAISDAVNTLLISEQMTLRDREIYKMFDVPDDIVPKAKGTCGRRVSDFLVTMAMQFANGSEQLSTRTSVVRQWKLGGFGVFRARNSTSRYGQQSAKVFGGLLFSRSPTTFWHEAPEMFRDVDMSGCYNRSVGRISVYLGQPIVLEPGSNEMILADGVDFVRSQSPNDGWMIKVTGNFASSNNVLIASTIDATTFENYRSRRTKARAEAGRPDFGSELENDDSMQTKLFSKRVEQGVVTNDTWTVIQALPRAMRDEYENLRVESIVFYHNDLIADDGPDFDRLHSERFASHLPWSSKLHNSKELRHREILDHEYVALRFPIHEYATRLGRERDRAQKEYGKGSGQDQALKIQANSMFGVLNSIYHATANIVAANIITACARGEAFSMQMSLNGIQVITDGCSYRIDRIPRCSFAECLRLKPDYTIQAATPEDRIPFYDPSEIPSSDWEFTDWYRQHVLQFFQDDSEALTELVMTHDF